VIGLVIAVKNKSVHCTPVSVIISVGYTDTNFYYQCGPHW